MYVLTVLDKSILKELDSQNFKADVISMIMDILDTEYKKEEFLSFMMKNRNELLSVGKLFYEVNKINNKEKNEMSKM